MALGKKTGGRQKGTPNKATATLKSMLEESLSEVGGKDYLKLQAVENPAAYMAMLGKLIPRDLNVDVAATVIMQVVTGVPDGDC